MDSILQERLRKYSKRLAAAMNEQELANSKRSLAVDVGAANRFIEHAIPDLTDEQKTMLRDVCMTTTPLPSFLLQQILAAWLPVSCHPLSVMSAGSFLDYDQGLLACALSSNSHNPLSSTNLPQMHKLPWGKGWGTFQQLPFCLALPVPSESSELPPVLLTFPSAINALSLFRRLSQYSFEPLSARISGLVTPCFPYTRISFLLSIVSSQPHTLSMPTHILSRRLLHRQGRPR